MGFQLYYNPDLIMPFDRLPPASIALDGVVEGIHIDLANYRFSFDHHGGRRFGILATSEQVCLAIELGLEVERITSVFCNDLDRDVAAALWLLYNPTKAAKVRERVTGLGRVDCHGPFAPGGVATPALHKVFPPPGAAVSMSDIERCVRAVGEWLEGNELPTEPLPPDPTSFAIIIPTGEIVPAPKGSFGLYQSGYHSFVLGKEVANNSWKYTALKYSDFVPIPLEPLYEALARIEDGWGGSSTCVGSPRGKGSRLPPTQIADLVRTVYAANCLGSKEKGAAVGGGE